MAISIEFSGNTRCWQCCHFCIAYAVKKQNNFSKNNNFSIEPGTSCDPFWCLPDWANLASFNWGIFNFCLCTNWPLNLDDLTKINRAWLYKNHKSLSLTANVKLAQSGRYASVHTTGPRVQGKQWKNDNFMHYGKTRLGKLFLKTSMHLRPPID